MDLAYNQQYTEFREELRSFLDTHGGESPPAYERGKPSSQAVAWQQKLIEHGHAARTIPKEYGGYRA